MELNNFDIDVHSFCNIQHLVTSHHSVLIYILKCESTSRCFQQNIVLHQCQNCQLLVKYFSGIVNQPVTLRPGPSPGLQR